jgi:pimeloyl-ACP methyl ester carboxylesterase
MRSASLRREAALTARLAVLAALAFSPFAANAAEPVTTDYYVTHRSIDEVYAGSKMDPTVLIHLREVVLPGNERRAPGEGKVLVLAHGATTPGYIAFDAACGGCSMMRFFALAGWDVFTLDYEGYGLSTRQPTMDYPEAFPQAKAPTHTEVAVDDLARAIEFARALRGVDKVHVLGWSLGASRTAPIYTIQHPERVARLVLFAPGYRSLGAFDSSRGQADATEARKVLLSRPSLAGWQRFGATEQSLVPDALEVYRAAMLASDPRSGELGGQVRYPAGRIADLLRGNPQFDASKIKLPTLVIRGANDTFGSTADSERLVEEIGSAAKKFVEIPGGSHMLPYERVNQAFFQAVQEFLEAK